MGERVKSMLAAVPAALQEGNREKLRQIRELDDQVDVLRDRIIEYLGMIGRQPLTELQGSTMVGAMTATDDFERIGDLIETDLIDAGNEIIEQKLEPSETTRVILSELFEATYSAVDAAARAIADEDQQAAQEVLAARDEIDQLTDAALKHQARRISADAPERLAHHRLEVSLIDKLRRIYSLSRHLAKLSLPQPVAGEAG
jgi:phosphate:Na+ symporter